MENKNNTQTENLESIETTARQEQTAEITIEESSIPEHKPKVIEIVTGSSIFKYFLSAMIIFGVCFISCLFVFNVLFTQVTVVGLSMLPTINQSSLTDTDSKHSDYVYISKSSIYNNSDIVVIKEGKTTSNSKLIKRIVATPGQTITFKKTGLSPANNKLYYDIYLNGNKLVEDYIYDQNLILYTAIENSSFYTYYTELIAELKMKGEFSDTMEANEYFVMGDNRNNSTDSRFFGPIKQVEIEGKVVLQVKYGQNLFTAIWSKLFSKKYI